MALVLVFLYYLADLSSPERLSPLQVTRCREREREREREKGQSPQRNDKKDGSLGKKHKRGDRAIQPQRVARERGIRAKLIATIGPMNRLSLTLLLYQSCIRIGCPSDQFNSIAKLSLLIQLTTLNQNRPSHWSATLQCTTGTDRGRGNQPASVPCFPALYSPSWLSRCSRHCAFVLVLLNPLVYKSWPHPLLSLFLSTLFISTNPYLPFAPLPPLSSPFSSFLAFTL
jgi:hypothetical protein